VRVIDRVEKGLEASDRMPLRKVLTGHVELPYRAQRGRERGHWRSVAKT
jgi:hypothetical protein